MKKLLIAVTAVASAFGLYAADAGFVSGTSFDDDSMVGINTIDALNTKDGNAWSTTDGEASLEVKAYAQGEKLDELDRPAYWSGSVTEKNYLGVKTKLDKALTRTLATSMDLSTGDAYVDTLVKFTACDEEITTLADGSAKLAVWVKEDETSGKTNLMVTAGYIAGQDGSVSQKNYDCGTFTGLDAWHRLTIKSIGDITSGNYLVGFVVFVDGVAKGYTTADDSIGYNGYKDLLTPVATLWDKAGNLFPSLKGTGDGTVSAIALSGQGGIDDISFTTTAPTFAEKGTVTFTWTPADFTAIEIGNETVDVTKGSYVCEYKAGQTYTISATPIDGKMVTSSPSFTPDAAGKSFEITTAAVAAKLVIDGAPQQFTTVAAAFKAIAGISSPASKVELKLAAGYDQSITLGNANIGEFVLDLAGQTLSGSPASIAVAAQTMTLTITNSTTTVGKVTGMVSGGMGTLNIQAGQFDGVVGASKGLFTGGSFKNTNQKATLDARAPEGFEFVESDGYYTLKEKFLNGSGTEADPWQISKAAELQKLATYVADGGVTEGKFFKQTAEIDLTGITWEGIGAYVGENSSDNRLFCGVYDGNKQTVKNVTFAKKEYNGLFGNLGGAAQIKDLTITVAGIASEGTATSYGFGVAAGYAMGTDVLLENITVNPATDGQASIQGTHNMGGIGARLAGKITLKNCTNNLDISTTYSKIGGMCAIASQRDAAGAIVFEGCVNNGTITGVGLAKANTEAGSDGCAGILAYIQDDSSTDPKAGNKPVSFIDCVNNGTLQHTGDTGTTKACIASILGKAGGQSYVTVSGNTAKADYLAVASGTAPAVLVFATVDTGVATFTSTLAKDTQFKVMAVGGTATFELAAENDYIAFDYNLATATYNITSATGVIETKTNETDKVITFTAKAAAPQGVVPGEPQSIPGSKDMDEKTAQEAASQMTATPTATQLAAGLTSADLQVKAKAIEGGWVAVAEPADKYIPEVETTKEGVQPIEVTDTNFSATIKNAKKGFYYGFVAADELKANVTFAPAATFVTPEADGELKLTAPKATGNARFYKLSVSAEPINVKVDVGN